jgi:thiol:disulfide interchange protein DsbD
MEDIKKFLGVVLIGVGIYYLNLVIPAFVYWPLVAVLCLGGAVLIVVKSAQRAAFPRLRVAWRLAGVVLVMFALYAAVAQVPASFGVASRMEAASPVVVDKPTTGPQVARNGTATSAAATSGTAETKPVRELTWLTDEKAGIEEVKRSGKPMIVDFTAAWCAACKQLDRKTFSEAKVRAQLEGFVRVKIDCTKETPENAALQKKYGSPSLPTVAFVTKDGEIRSELTLYEFEAADKFLERLGKVPR